MRWLFVLAVLVSAIGCAKKDDPSAPSPGPKTAANVPVAGGGGTVGGAPYVPGAGPVSPVQAPEFGDSGGGVGQAAKNQARNIAGKMSASSGGSGTADDSGN